MYALNISEKSGWNIRDYHHLGERLCNGVSFLFNTILSILLIRTKDQFMQAYNRVLLQNCIADLVFTLIYAMGEIQVEINNGVFIFVVNGFVKEWPLFWHYTFIWLHMTVGNMTLLVVNVQFFFRYMLICKGVSLTKCQLSLLGLVIYILSGLVSFVAILALLDTSDQVATFGHLMRDPIWFDENGKQAIFVGASRTNVYSIMYIVCGVLANALSCGIIFWLGVATFRTLRKSGHMMSAKTKASNVQLNRILIFEASLVLFLVYMPICGLISALLLDINIVGFGIIMTMVLGWMPMANPIVTIILVDPYRRAVFGWMRRFIIKRRVHDTHLNHLKIPELVTICG